MWCRPITIENSKLLQKFNKISPINFQGYAFYPFIFLSGEKSEENRFIYNHELIHLYQFEETLFIGYILIMTSNFLFNICKYRNFRDAYRNLAFEKEAYDHMNDLDYVKKRKRFAWLRCKE